MHDKGFIINARIKKINKRLYIIKHIFKQDPSSFRGTSMPGILNKYNLVCSCGLCKVNTKNQGFKISDKRKMLRENDFYDDYDSYFGYYNNDFYDFENENQDYDEYDGEWFDEYNDSWDDYYDWLEKEEQDYWDWLYNMPE